MPVLTGNPHSLGYNPNQSFALMPISSGTKFGPYEILAPLGAGGMGEVYKARDSRLDRVVAIKVLPADFSANPEVKERFEREARTISSLSHPHVCALYDIGRQDGVDYLVLEYLEGETLADKLRKGPLALELLFKYAIQIAEALEKAHKHGVIHRDLKPGNIMITKTGAKLMDFGLAKPHAVAATGPALEAMTVSKPLTAEGTIVGTFQYMAPEQLEGHEADARSDIFAFGCVLYEMATGRRAFQGKSQASLFAAILASEPPPISSLRPVSPSALERIVTACLQKDPEDRLQTAHDLRLQLEWAMQPGSSPGSAVSPGLGGAVRASQKMRRNIIMASLVMAGVLAGVLGSRFYGRRPQGISGMVRSEIGLPQNIVLTPVSESNQLVVSPDSSRIAFIAQSEGKISLFVRPLGSSSFQRLDGTDGAAYPFWSPDSHFIGFFAAGKLKKVEAVGGVVQILCDAPAGRGGSWNQQGTIIFAPNIFGTIYKVSEAGGDSQPVTHGGNQRFTHRLPYFLPDGRHFLYVSNDTGVNEGADLHAGLLGSAENKLVLRGGSDVAYWDGKLFYMKDGNLVAQTFDAGGLTLAGNPIPVAEQVEYYMPRNIGNFSVSRTGVVIYRTASQQKSQLFWYDGNGKELSKAGEPGYYRVPRISHDGQRIAVFRSERPGGNGDLWMLSSTGNTFSRITFEPSESYSMAWSPDDKQMAVAVYKGYGEGGLKIMDSGGSAKSETVLQQNEVFYISDWSKDGKFILATSQDPRTGLDVTLVNLAEKKAIPLIHTKFDELSGSFAPDGKFVSYRSSESGRFEAYVASFPGLDAKWQISTEGTDTDEFRPIAWNHDGSELFFLDSKGHLMGAQVATGNGFHASTPRQLLSVARGIEDFDLTQDGRFLVNTPVEDAASPPISLILNWNPGSR